MPRNIVWTREKLQAGFDRRLERFWKRVNKNGPIPTHRPELGPCWEWTSPRNSEGYGTIKWYYQNDKTHRLVWKLTNGAIAAGMKICHHCDNPPCCNPAHLFEGTNQENIIDALKKGRLADVSGGKNPRATVTEDQVKEIRRRHASGESQREIARTLGTNFYIVFDIVHRRSWKHI